MIDHSNLGKRAFGFLLFLEAQQWEGIQPKKRKMGTPWWRDTRFDRRVLQRGKVARQTLGSGPYQLSGEARG